MYATTFRGTTETNKVLRSTFLLLALTLIPTIGGTFAGIALGLPAMFVASPWLSFIGFLAVAWILIMGIHTTKDSAAAIPILGAFTFVMGAILSSGIQHTLNFSNGPQIIAAAVTGTVALLLGCSGYAMTTKRDFSSMGGFLFGSLLAVIALSFLNILFLHMPVIQLLIACVTVVLFSVFLVYDVQRVVQGGESNYIIATTEIYLDLINIFSSLLNIFGLAGDD